MGDNVKFQSLYAQSAVGERQIRIIRLLNPPEAEASELHVEFEIYDLSNAAAVYTAISHTWGSEPFDRDVVYQDGTRIPVTKSCWDALNVSLWHCPNRRIWIDQLSINQQDAAEKSKQILLMKDIYASAEFVAIWLGHCREYSSAEWALLSQQSSTAGKDSWDALYGTNIEGSYSPAAPKTSWVDLRHGTPSAVKQKLGHGLLLLDQIYDYEYCHLHEKPELRRYKHEGIPLLKDVYAWQGVQEIFQRMWFTRKWDVQETGSNKANYMWIDRMRMKFLPLVLLTSPTFGYRANPVDPVDPMMEVARRKQKLQLGAKHAYDCLHATSKLFEGRGREQSQSLMWLLVYCRDFRVSDPRDHFYSLHALASDRRALPVPNYSLTFGEVKQQHLKYFVGTQQYPLLLSTSGMRETHQCLAHSHAPTWSPSWFPAERPCAHQDSHDTRRTPDPPSSSGRSTVLNSAGGDITPLSSAQLSASGTDLCIRVSQLSTFTAIHDMGSSTSSGLQAASTFISTYANLALYASGFYHRTQSLADGSKICCPSAESASPRGTRHDETCRKELMESWVVEVLLFELFLTSNDPSRESEWLNTQSHQANEDELRWWSCIAITKEGRIAFVPSCTVMRIS